MNKKTIKFLVIAAFTLVIVFLIAALVVLEKKKSVLNSNTHKIASLGQAMTEDEKRALNLYRLGNFEVVARDAAGKITAYRFTGLRDEKSITPEFMTDPEKIARGLGTDVKAQVLERNASGTIVSYKIINRDSDVITKSHEVVESQ
jgi:hypothetical protein